MERRLKVWCADNIHRSKGDIRKLMALAGADDPEAAIAKERTDARSRMTANRANVRPVGINTFRIEPAQPPGRPRPTVDQFFNRFCLSMLTALHEAGHGCLVRGGRLRASASSVDWRR